MLVIHSLQFSPKFYDLKVDSANLEVSIRKTEVNSKSSINFIQDTNQICAWLIWIFGGFFLDD